MRFANLDPKGYARYDTKQRLNSSNQIISTNRMLEIFRCRIFIESIRSLSSHSTISNTRRSNLPQVLPYRIACILEIAKKDIFGQDYALKTIINHIKSRKGSPGNQKALSLLLTGFTGTGKTHTSYTLAKLLFKLGNRSKCFLHIRSNLIFTISSSLEEQEEYLYKLIRDQLKSCPKSLIILDEVDRLPPGLLNSICPFLDFHPSFTNFNSSQSIFLFITNIGGERINSEIERLWLENSRVLYRDQMKAIETLILNDLMIKKNGLQESDVLKKSLIDDIVVFMPLERQHVVNCINKNYSEITNTNESETLKSIVKYTIDELEFFPESHKIFSKTGCKQVYGKVAYFASVLQHDQHQPL
ncbi:MAG: Torsin [Marteilia pararefringens]